MADTGHIKLIILYKLLRYLHGQLVTPLCCNDANVNHCSKKFFFTQRLHAVMIFANQSRKLLLFTCGRSLSPRHKHWPAGPAHFSDRRTSSGQYILSVTGPYGPPRYMSGHQISNSVGPNDDNSQYVFFARSPVPHLGSFRAALLLQRDASVSRVRVGHVNQTH